VVQRTPQQSCRIHPTVSSGTDSYLVKIMDANFITALAGVLGSMNGASAAIATTWISQKSQTLRKQAKWGGQTRQWTKF